MQSFPKRLSKWSLSADRLSERLNAAIARQYSTTFMDAKSLLGSAQNTVELRQIDGKNGEHHMLPMDVVAAR